MVIETGFAQLLLAWYDSNGRADLPWRNDITAYRVWVSEIMLQQTQVTTVIPYFKRFVAAFPNVRILANAPLDEVLHRWTGLGYYARGRNLHKAAGIICTKFAAELPADHANLQQLPGIGRSTAGAICAIAFNQPQPILDGNVKRVLSRYFRVAGWPGQSSVQKNLWQLAAATTPKQRCADYTQAIMDLGATLCTRSKPNCSACPLQSNCQAHASGTTAQYPASKPRKSLPVQTRLLLIVINEAGDVLLQQRPPTGLWGGLWSFPECPHDDDITATCQQLGLTADRYRRGEPRRHTFSHYHLDYTPVYIDARPQTRIADSGLTWINPAHPGQLGLPRPVQQLLCDFPL